MLELINNQLRKKKNEHTGIQETYDMQEICLTALFLNLNMFFSARNKPAKIVRIPLEVMIEKLTFSSA